MIGGTAGNQLLALRMECVIELFYFQDLLPSQDDKRLIQRKAQYLIRCHQFPPAGGSGLPVFRRIV